MISLGSDIGVYMNAIRSFRRTVEEGLSSGS
jgi:hypothetical protein